MIVTIDGPAGSGKSTVAKLLAKIFGLIYLDTGAIYRSLALFALRKGVSWEEEDKLVELVKEMKIEFIPTETNQKVILNDEDITEMIRTEEIGMGASIVSRHKKVRAALVNLQRSFKEKGSLVAEGRDTGTVIFPEAEVKVFLTADITERAKRRWKELKEKGIDADLNSILESLKKRDLQDSTRKVAPLVPAEDAVIIDTTNLTIDDVVKRISELIDGKRSI